MALETVLVPVGQTDRDRLDVLAGTVADIAGPAGARVVIAHVYTDAEFNDVLQQLEYEAPAQTHPNELAARNAVVRELANRLTNENVYVDVRGRVGSRGDSIVDLAREENADLVVVGGRSRSPTGKAVFGSTAQQVMLDSPCPVTFVRTDEPRSERSRLRTTRSGSMT